MLSDMSCLQLEKRKSLAHPRHLEGVALRKLDSKIKGTRIISIIESLFSQDKLV